MRIEDLQAVLRPRSGWQAVDLGCLLWQQQLRSILIVWFAASVPLAAGALFVGQGPTFVAFMLFWWLLPLASRGVLFFLSRSLFGEQLVGIRRIKAIGGFGFRGLLRALFFERFVPWRTFSAPIGLLEGLSGSERRQRQRVLDRSQGSIVSVAILSVAFVLVLAIGLLGLIRFLREGPLGSSLDIEFFLNPTLLFGVYFLATSLIEPLHVAIGFSIYLDGRSHVEGWDVELALRALGRRLEAQEEVRQQRQPLGYSSFGGVLAVVVLMAFQAGPAIEPEGVVGSDPQATVEHVLNDPDFGDEHTNWRVVRRIRRDREEADASTDGSELTAAKGIFGVLSRGMLFLFYGLLVVALYMLIRQLAYAWIQWRERARLAPETETAGWSIVEEALRGGTDALPTDVSAAARQLFADGRQAEALGLVYRASLLTLVEQHGVTIRSSDTESTCLRRARRSLTGSVPESFGTVTLLWQRAAYAELVLESSELDLALEHLSILRAETPTDAGAALPGAFA